MTFSREEESIFYVVDSLLYRQESAEVFDVFFF